MHVETYTVTNTTEQIEIFVRAGLEHAGDVPNIIYSVQNLIQFLKSKYKTYKNGEHVLRPKFFLEFGGDCDNQLTYLIAYYSRVKFILEGTKKIPLELKNLVAVTEREKPNSDPTHIFLYDKKLNIVWDALPHRPFAPCTHGCLYYQMDFLEG